MSWKKYGGTNKLDKINNISVNTVVTDKFTLKNFYVGDWDICGGLRAKDDTNLMKDLYVAGDIYGTGDITIDGSMNVLNTNIVGNVFIAENAFVRQNIFMDLSGGTMLHGENRRFGFNTTSPQATIDISSDLVRSIDIHTSTVTNKNVVARNVFNQGMTVNVEQNRAYIDFYVDNSMNLAAENFNGRLVYEQGGNFTIDVSNIVKFKPRVVFSQDLSKNIVADERVIIYGNPLADVPYIPSIYGDNTFKTGTAAYLVAGDNSSNAFFRLGTEKGSGMTLGGGYLPMNKIMGVVALIDASNTKYPTMNIISGNLISNLKTSIGVNKYNVSTLNGANRYAMDINGPIKVAHQELIVAADISFQVYKSVFFGNTGYAVGSPLNINPYTQYFLKTLDGGYTWASYRIVDLNGNPNPNTLESTAHYFNAIYAISATDILIAGDNRYFYRSTNGGQNWGQIRFVGTNDGINTTAIFLSNQGLDFERLIVGSGINSGDINNGSIFNSPTSTWNVGGIPSTYISTGLSAVNAIHGYGLNTVIVGAGGIVPYRTYISFVVNPVFGTRVATSSTFYDVKVFNDGLNNHVIAVGSGVIYYAHDLSWNGTAYTVTWNSVPGVSGTLRSVQILDSLRAIAVGDNGLIMYSIDGFASWKTVSEGMLDNSFLITGINLSTISILNDNDFVVSGTIQNFVDPNTLGRTKMFNLYAPYFLNRPLNHVLEASGNIVMSGDLQINDAGQILTNTSNFNILPTVAQEINIGSTAVGGNTNVKANLDVTLNITGHENMLLYGDASFNSRFFLGGDASLNSNLYVVKDSSFNGRIYVGGDASLNSNLYVVKDSSFNGRIYVGGDASLNSKLFVKGDASLNSRLFVGGDASLNSNLYVVKDSSFNGRIYVGGDASLNSNLYVVKDSSFNGRIYVGGDASLNSKLFVKGDVSLNSRLFVGGDASLNSNLYVVKDSSFNGRIYVGGDASLNSNLYVVKDSSFNGRIYVGGDASLNSNLYVVKDSSFNGRIYVGGDASLNSNLYVVKDSSFNGRIYVGGDASLNSNLYVVKDSSFNGRIYVGGDASLNSKLFVKSDVSFNSRLFVGGDTSLNSNLYVVKDSSFNGRIFVGGDASLNSNLYVVKDSSFNGRIFVGGDASLNSNLYVVKDSSFNGRIFVGGDASLNSNLYVVKDSSFNCRIFVGGDASLNSNLYVVKDSSFNGRIFVGGDASLNSNLYVVKDSSFNGRIFVGGDASLNSNLYVVKDSSFNGRIFVGGDASLNSNLYVVKDSSFNGRLFVGGDVSLNSKLFVKSDASLNSRLFVGGDVSLNSNLYVVKDSSFNGRIFVGGDASFNSNLYVVKDSSFNGRIFVGGDASLNSNLYVVKDSSFNGRIFVGGDASLNSNLYVVKDSSFNGRIFVGGDASLNSNLYVVKDSSFNGRIFVGGDASLNSKLFVKNDVSMNSKLFVGGDVSFNTKLFVGGDTSLNSNLYVTGKTKIFDLSAQNADFTGVVFGNTFDSRPGSSLTIGGTNAGNITIKTSSGSTNVLTLGDAGSNVQILGNLTLPGSVTSTNVNNLEIKNKTILLNDEAIGTNVSNFAGLQIRDNGVDNKGYFLLNGRSDGYLFKSTQNANRVNLDVSGLFLSNGLTQGFVVLKATSSLDISADYTITTGLVDISNIQLLDTSLNRRVERTSATTATTQVIATNLLSNGLYIGKPVDNYIANSQMDITGNAFISKLGLGTNSVNTNYTLEVNNNARVSNNLDVSNSLTVQNNINLYGRIVQW
jgi:photosystem II stability/assembly factor-like uncharacterized protein